MGGAGRAVRAGGEQAVCGAVCVILDASTGGVWRVSWEVLVRLDGLFCSVLFSIFML